jgi:hypothetical protein
LKKRLRIIRLDTSSYGTSAIDGRVTVIWSSCFACAALV